MPILVLLWNSPIIKQLPCVYRLQTRLFLCKSHCVSLSTNNVSKKKYKLEKLLSVVCFIGREQSCSLSSAAHPPRLIAHIRHQSRGALASARRYRHHRLRLLRLCNGADDDDDEEGGRHRTIKLLFLPNLASIFQNTIEMGPFSISLLFTFLWVLLF